MIFYNYFCKYHNSLIFGHPVYNNLSNDTLIMSNYYIPILELTLITFKKILSKSYKCILYKEI